MYNREVLNAELEKIEKPAGIANPKDFRNEIVMYVMRYRASHGGETPRWNSYEKIKNVIEKKMFSSTEEILPIISFTPKSNEDEQKKHDNFVNRMKEKGYTLRMTQLLVDWFNRYKKNS
jgi:serine protein kinase